MARYNDAITVTFNDNDGRVGFRCTPAQGVDVGRHQQIFGKWRTRWILLKAFWRGLKWMESYAATYHQKQRPPLWVFRAEIPE